MSTIRLAAAEEIVSVDPATLVEAYTSERFVCLDSLAWLAANLGNLLRRERLPVRQPHLLHKRAWLRYEPVGVAGIISTWNFPLAVPLTQAASAVAAGKGVVLKPSEVVTGGKRPEIGLSGWFHEPTVLTGEPEAALVRRREISGPAVRVDRIDNHTEGVTRANDSSYGLGASVWTRDRERARRVAGRLEAGSVWMNDHAYSYGLGQAPWGGWKESGIGHTHSRHGVYAMSRLTYEDADRGRLTPPWWYPYSDMAVDGFRGALGVLYGNGLTARLDAARRHRRGLIELGRRAVRR